MKPKRLRPKPISGCVHFDEDVDFIVEGGHVRFARPRRRPVSLRAMHVVHPNRIEREDRVADRAAAFIRAYRQLYESA